MNKVTLEKSTGIPSLDNRIIEETSKNYSEVKDHSLRLSLSEAFVWSMTPEGQEFWNHIEMQFSPVVRITKPEPPMTVRQLCEDKVVLHSTNPYSQGRAVYRLVRVGDDLFHILMDGAIVTHYWYKLTGDQTIEDLEKLGFEVAR